MATRYCDKCGKMMDEKEFYISNNLEKYPDGKLNTCKKCLTMHVDNWDPETYIWILKECDVPYIKKEWDVLLEKTVEKGTKITGVTILGRYLSKMKLKQFKDFRFDDTEAIAEKERQEKINSLKARGVVDEQEIQDELNKDFSPAKPAEYRAPQTEVGTPDFYDPEFQIEEDNNIEITDEDKIYLRLKWGRGYTPAQWLALEQMFVDFVNSYDIQTAGHKDTLKKVCKASLRADELMDAGDIDGAQKMIKVYNDLMKSGNFQGIQNKEAQGEGIDSIGEIVRICEQQGFIPRYYVDSPQDKVDKTLLDMQHYTHKLVTEELNLGNMIESSLIQIQKDKEQEEQIILEDIDEEEVEDNQLFDYEEDNPMTTDDYIEANEWEENLREQDDSFFEGNDE